MIKFRLVHPDLVILRRVLISCSGDKKYILKQLDNMVIRVSGETWYGFGKDVTWR